MTRTTNDQGVFSVRMLFNRVASALKWFVVAFEHPKLTTAEILTLPYLTRGKRFGLDAIFADGHKPEDRNTDHSISNPLASYFLSHKEGPGIWKWMHYFDIYDRHFSKFVGREVHVLEIGIYSGGSLPMWREYFGEQSHIYGVDIEEACRAYEGERIKIMIDDQADRMFWAEFKKSVPVIDILIDDGGHLAEQQLVTLEE